MTIEDTIQNCLANGTRVWMASGETYEHREHLKALGWRWVASEQVWVHLGGDRSSTPIISVLTISEIHVEEVNQW